MQIQKPMTRLEQGNGDRASELETSIMAEEPEKLEAEMVTATAQELLTVSRDDRLTAWEVWHGLPTGDQTCWSLK